MLLPTKGISGERALLSVGASVLDVLDSPATVSGLWERFTRREALRPDAPKITFDWFTLALAMLFAMGALDWNTRGRLERRHVAT
ncbi:MAG: hypothetical protein LBK54_06435 [Propionibacteriaceae bacterium]|jgi:hypothetical protein|nr:hypothetical protein [Propionibacteriaceae bacterium]